MRKVENPNQQQKHCNSILNHHVLFLDYDFKSLPLNCCSLLIGHSWVIDMVANLCTNLCEVFQAAYLWNQMVLFLDSHKKHYMHSVQVERWMTSPLSRALPHPPSIGMSSQLAANLLVEQNVGYCDASSHSSDVSL